MASIDLIFEIVQASSHFGSDWRLQFPVIGYRVVEVSFLVEADRFDFSKRLFATSDFPDWCDRYFMSFVVLGARRLLRSLQSFETGQVSSHFSIACILESPLLRKVQKALNIFGERVHLSIFLNFLG